MRDTHATITPELIERFARIVGPAHALTDAADHTPYLKDWRDRYRSDTPLVLRPSSTGQVADIVKLAASERIALVPQSGATGLVGGHLPYPGRREVIISLSRMTAVRDVDAVGGTMTLEAGVTLAKAQQTADDVGMLFPLSLSSEGTCCIGGNLATNAGGVNVLAYGNARALTLGLEVVTADGQIWNGLRRLHKDNTGYDLRDLFIGSEGTLGIITAAVLKLLPKPRGRATAFAGLPTLDAVAAFFDTTSARAGHRLTAFELIPRVGLEFVLQHGEKTQSPLDAPCPWYVLFDISSHSGPDEAQAIAQSVLEEALDGEQISDATLAASLTQADELWRLRELLSEVQKREGGSIKNDVSVPIAAQPQFIEQAGEAVVRLVPGCRPVPFGHWGDGNVHYNVSQPVGMDRADFLSHWDTVTAAVNDIVLSLDGSISAEHGIGRMKRDRLAEIKSGVEIDMMRAIKSALDPHNILNPGKVL